MIPSLPYDKPAETVIDLEEATSACPSHYKVFIEQTEGAPNLSRITGYRIQVNDDEGDDPYLILEVTPV